MNSFTNYLRATLPENSIITNPKETIIPEDLCAIILSRLPIKSIISFKLVCKNWKSLVESPFFRDLYLSHNQKSHSSSWSFMCRGCETEKFSRFFISSFLTEKFENRQGRVVAYTDVGLVLIM
ncbi:hypothetical protein Bca52824_027158 [Brassica carinata]|uniref:F-box domain-containing protein n=1 Tax=Brassica carinata TaxID=52824 RepID=A0A8X7V8L6_BRACI|nr:hypothetical protein Bca52824_027158 [Brassica carinata]